MKANPANYAHLVEFGHHVAKGGALSKAQAGRRVRKSRSGRTGLGRSVVFVLARPFLRPAFSTSRGAVVSRMKAALSTFQAREAKRLARLTQRRLNRN